MLPPPSPLVQQVIQGFRQGVRRVHSPVLDEGITEDADVDGDGEVGGAEIAVLPEGEIVVMKGMPRAGIGVEVLRSIIWVACPEPHHVEAISGLGQRFILRIEEP